MDDLAEFADQQLAFERGGAANDQDQRHHQAEGHHEPGADFEIVN